jgi:hypothetical protein
MCTIAMLEVWMNFLRSDPTHHSKIEPSMPTPIAKADGHQRNFDKD